MVSKYDVALVISVASIKYTAGLYKETLSIIYHRLWMFLLLFIYMMHECKETNSSVGVLHCGGAFSEDSFHKSSSSLYSGVHVIN